MAPHRDGDRQAAGQHSRDGEPGDFATTGTAQVWQIGSASQTAIAQLADVAIANNNVATTVPRKALPCL